jgi:hypothetical protein
MTFRCIYCGIRHDYYPTDENASRQNCQVSDSGYHGFGRYTWCWPFRRKNHTKDRLLEHRRKKRPATI